MWGNLVTIKENVEQDELDVLPHYLILTTYFLGVGHQIKEYKVYPTFKDLMIINRTQCKQQHLANSQKKMHLKLITMEKMMNMCDAEKPAEDAMSSMPI